MKEKFDINKNLRMLKYTLAKDDLYEFLDDVDSKMTKKIYSIIKSHERSIEDEGKGYDKIVDLITKCFKTIQIPAYIFWKGQGLPKTEK